MVAVQRESRRQSKLGGYVIAVIFLLVLVMVFRSSESDDKKTKPKPQEVFLVAPNEGAAEDAAAPTCPYQSFTDLTKQELYPTKGERHMVTPPKGGSLVLVCCETTKGPWSIVVHERWAPLGAKRFLEMVSSKYFDCEVPLFRCLHKFLCQFGLSSDASLSKLYKDTIPDDRNWLPEGKEHRQNDHGVKRFAQGYLAYAGSGKNSRNKQLIISLTHVGTLAGGSPWEVPFGELVGEDSFETLSKIYTGYGEKGPKQGDLMREGMTDVLRTEFPLLDYVKSCHIVDRQVQKEPY